MSSPATSAVAPHALPPGGVGGTVFSSQLTHSSAFLGPSSGAQSSSSTNPSAAAAALLGAAAVVSSASQMTASQVAVAAAPSPLAVAHLSGSGAFPVEYLCWSSAAPSLATVTTATLPIVSANASASLPLVAPHTAHALLGAQTVVSRPFAQEEERAAASLHALHRVSQQATRIREEEYKRSREQLRLEGGLDPRNILPRAAAPENLAPQLSPLAASLSLEDSDDDQFGTPPSIRQRSPVPSADDGRGPQEALGFPSVGVSPCSRLRPASGRGMSSSPEVWQGDGPQAASGDDGKEELSTIVTGLGSCPGRGTPITRPLRLSGRGAAFSFSSPVADPVSFPGAVTRSRRAAALASHEDSMTSFLAGIRPAAHSEDTGEQECPLPMSHQVSAQSTAMSTKAKKRKVAEEIGDEVDETSPRRAPSCSSSSSSFCSTIAALKSDDCEEEQTCRICLETPDPHEISSINGCAHLFCFGCIEKWADRENTCPLCKTRFNKIERLHRPPPTKPGKRKRGDVSDPDDAPKVKHSKKVKNRDQRADLVQPSGATVQDVIENMEATGFMRTLLATLGNSFGESAFGGILTITSEGGTSSTTGGRSRVVRINAAPATTTGVGSTHAAASAVARARSLASIIQVRRSGALSGSTRPASVVIDEENVLQSQLSGLRDVSRQSGGQRYTWAAADFLAPSSSSSPPPSRSYASNATDTSAGVTAERPLEIDDSEDEDDEVEVLSEVEVVQNPSESLTE